MGNVFYATRKELHIRLLNPGQVAANFQFMPLPGTMFGNPGDKEFRSTPRWATVHPEQVGCTATAWAHPCSTEFRSTCN